MTDKLRDIPIEPYSLVNQMADLWKVPVDVRQATNDQCWEFAAELFDQYAKTIASTASEVAMRLGRKEAGEEIAAAIQRHRDQFTPDSAIETELYVAEEIARDIGSEPPPDATSGRTDPGAVCKCPPELCRCAHAKDPS